MVWVITVAVLGGWAAVICGLFLSLVSATYPAGLPHHGGRPINPALVMLAGLALAALGLCSALCGADAARLLDVERAAQSAAARAAKEGE